MRKTNKVMAGVLTATLAVGLSGCGASPTSSATTAKSATSQPNESSCSDWDWNDELGVYECDQKGSSHHGHYFYGGTYYNSATALQNNAGYQSAVRSGTVKTTGSTSSATSSSSKPSTSPSKSGATTTGKSGFGSGAKGGFGG